MSLKRCQIKLTLFGVDIDAYKYYNFKKRLKDVRDQLGGIPQRKIAEKISITQTSVYRYENDPCKPFYQSTFVVHRLLRCFT